MNKKLMYGMLSLFAIGLVSAGYLVNSFVITTDIYEPFEVQYAILGDGGNYDGVTTCADYTGEWQDGQDVDVGGLYAGESRKVCTKINNLGEGDVDYTFSGEVTPGLGNLEECEASFDKPSVSGTATGSSETRDGVLVEIAGDATPATDCQVTLAVTRG